MYKVLIADDEKIIRIALKSMISWEDLGFSVEYSAEDGLSALETVRRYSPDLVIIDIMMPVMDGIEFVKEARRDGYSGEIIILSNHQNFQYAVEALRNRVSDYIMKTDISPSSLTQCLLKIRRRLDAAAQARPAVPDESPAATDLDLLRAALKTPTRMAAEQLSDSYILFNIFTRNSLTGSAAQNSLAANVTDIKKLFSNVKLRGTWGEVQLGTLLSQMLAPNQYASSVKVDSRSDGMVDFAVRIPSRDERTVWLPIDSKFPIEEYTRLADATDKAEAAAALKKLAQAVKLQADSIATKYIFPPSTTDFAVMYLPLEGLYAEITKLPELDGYLRKRRVIACGPTNLSALLSTLQTGFKTVAIEKRSEELWQLLSAFKVQFDKFTAVLEKTGKKLQEAQNTIEEAGRRTRTISNKLRTVADIGDDEAERLLSDGNDL